MKNPNAHISQLQTSLSTPAKLEPSKVASKVDSKVASNKSPSITKASAANNSGPAKPSASNILKESGRLRPNEVDGKTNLNRRF